MGITGRDLVLETRARVIELFELPFGFCKLVLAVDENNGAASTRDLRGKRIATEFPSLACEYLKAKRVKARIVKLSGAVELSVNAGIADAIIDLTSSGATLRANGLKAIDCLLSSSAVLIANKESMASFGVKEIISRISKLVGEK